jgi:hypothetical protein
MKDEPEDVEWPHPAPPAADGGGGPRRDAQFPGRPVSTSSDKRQQVPASSRPDLEETAECGK